MYILIVEDDERIAEALKQTLRVHGYESNYVGTGAAALTRFADADLVLLDLGLPDLDGHEVCRRIRELSCVPVIVLSGRTEELDRVMALHMGADDFVAKPFSRYELVARIQAVLRRAGGCPQHAADPAAPATVPLETSRPEPELHGPEQPPLHVGPIRLDPRTRKLFVDGSEVHITRKEFDLLAMLLEEPGAVMERQDIMCRVWDENWFGSTRTLDVHVGSLRSKLGHTEWIETVRGVGYRLAVPTAAHA
ncbi:putative two component system reponse regulator [Streptomyces bingchenggensis BCW-1]|uniref:Sensory transduction protein RegX3 n=1 Tax=Streptomyces bingchenggensis (strain BCW-1) TaxID=749414 RepID=D7BUX8_STRBB|nr:MULTISPECIES: response regulator transcription factor [Streptomyces]ADI05357.1 putative two component system reponse regulator [Streptomyces bingchenggensis BCW-1]